MAWRHKEPGHQQQFYWLGRLSLSLSLTKQDLIYLRQQQCPEMKMQEYFCFIQLPHPFEVIFIVLLHHLFIFNTYHAEFSMIGVENKQMMQ